MASLSQHKQKVHRFLDQVNKQKSDHVTKQQLVQWFMKITEDEDILKEEDFRQLKIQMEDSLDQWIDLYLREVCEIEPQNVKNIEFKQDECFDFLEWVLTTKITQKNQENQDEDEQNEQKEQNQQNQNPSNVSNKLSNKSKIQNKAEESGQKQQNVTKNRSNISQTNKSPQQEGKKSHLKQNAQRLAKSKLNHLQQQANEFVENLFGSKQKQQSIKKSQLSEPQQDIKLTQDKYRYKEYIETIFEHYCKINFGLAKDNTFESMQKNVNIITINKFMIFCNDFQINVLVAASLPKDSKDKTSKTAIRNQLMEVFKKNSVFHKQMTIELFIQALQKIGQVAFARLKEQQKKSQKNISGEQQKSQKPSQQSKVFKLSYELTKMIKYMEISNFKQFKQKMTKLNINYSLKFSKQLHEKKSLFNYKFKYDAEESKKHIQQAPLIPKNPNEHRNIIHKQGQQKAIKPRPNLDLGKPPMNTKNSTPNMALVSNPNGANRQKKTLSTKNLTVHQRNTPSSKMQRNIIPYKKPSHQSVERLSSNPQPNPLAGIEGYANIHLAKKGLLLVDQNNQKMSAMRKKGQYQLNNVIEEARKQTQTNPHQVYFDYMDSRRSNRAMSNISNSKPLSQYSRDPASNQSFRNGRQDEEIQLPFQSNPYGKLPPKSIHQNNPPQSNLTPLQKSRLQAYNQLQNLIDFDGSDEDQYLDQHLKRQKENNNQIGARVNKKISSLSYKN